MKTVQKNCHRLYNTTKMYAELTISLVKMPQIVQPVQPNKWNCFFSSNPWILSFADITLWIMTSSNSNELKNALNAKTQIDFYIRKMIAQITKRKFLSTFQALLLMKSTEVKMEVLCRVCRWDINWLKMVDSSLIIVITARSKSYHD